MKPQKPFEIVTHKGKNIVVVDLSNTKPSENIELLSEIQPKIAAFPSKSVLALTDVTDAIFDSESSQALKDFASKNTPYMKASAVVGADGLRAVLLSTVRLFTKREIKAFSTREGAMDWLVNRG